MMMNTKPISHTRMSRPAYLLVIAVLLALGSTHTAQAQWQSNGNNINTTNSGNVGVGTSAPSTKLDIAPAAGDGIHVGSTGSDSNTSDVSITNRGINITTAGFTTPNTYQANFGNPNGGSGYDSGG